jgi:CRP-like cAMP-binding protein
MTGLTVETVSRTISRLKDAGQLDVRGSARERQVWVTVK